MSFARSPLLAWKRIPCLYVSSHRPSQVARGAGPVLDDSLLFPRFQHCHCCDHLLSCDAHGWHLPPSLAIGGTQQPPSLAGQRSDPSLLHRSFDQKMVLYTVAPLALSQVDVPCRAMAGLNGLGFKPEASDHGRTWAVARACKLSFSHNPVPRKILIPRHRGVAID